MNRFFVVVITIFSGLITLCALSTALTSAASSMASSTASAAASTALMTSQCVNGLMVLVAIIAGAGIGIGAATIRSTYQQKQSMQRPLYTDRLPSRTWDSPRLPPPTIIDDEDDELVQALINIIQDNQR